MTDNDFINRVYVWNLSPTRAIYRTYLNLQMIQFVFQLYFLGYFPW